MQSWELGFQFAMPIGFRREMSGVRNAQLQLAKERAKLQEAELELSHQLAFAIRDMEAAQVLSQTNFNRRIAAQRQVEAVAAAYETGTITFDVLLSSQQRLAQAESDYYRSVINYNKAIMQVHYRKGSLLEYNGVYLAEGPWPGKAYFDARRRARARDASTYMDYGFTQPKVISRGPYEQQADVSTGIFGNNEQDAQTPSRAIRRSPNWCPRPTRNRPIPVIQPDRPGHAGRTQASARGRGSAGKAAVKKSTTVQATTGNRGCRVRLEKSVQDYAQAGNTTGRLPGSVGRATSGSIPHENNQDSEPIVHVLNGRTLRVPRLMNLARIHRLLNLISLLQAGKGYHVEGLAQECGVSRRTIFRDLDLLRSSGVPLRYDEDQQQYHIAGSNYLPPTNFTPEEALALIVLCHEMGDRAGLPFLNPARSRGRKTGKRPARPAPRSTPGSDQRPADSALAQESLGGQAPRLRSIARGRHQAAQRAPAIPQPERRRGNPHQTQSLPIVFQPPELVRGRPLVAAPGDADLQPRPDRRNRTPGRPLPDSPRIFHRAIFAQRLAFDSRTRSGLGRDDPFQQNGGAKRGRSHLA